MQSDQFQITAHSETRHWWFRARRNILANLVSAVLPPSRDTFVVDVGCCTGGNSAALQARYSCVGVDHSPEAIALARQRFPQGEFVCAEAPNDLEGLAEHADLFLLADMLEHVEYDRAMLAELVRMAKPGAFFLVTVPADMSLWSSHDESHGHYRRYDAASLRSLWEGLPVSVRLFSFFNSRLYPVVKAARMIGRIRGCAYGRAGTDLSVPPQPVNWILERVFAGEQWRLLALLRGQPKAAYRRGVSLLALLEKREAENEPRLASECPKISKRLLEPVAWKRA